MDEKTEAAEFHLIREIAERTGWSISVTTRGDADSMRDEELTDAEWEIVRHSRAWRNLGDMTDGQWERIASAVEDALASSVS